MTKKIKGKKNNKNSRPIFIKIIYYALVSVIIYAVFRGYFFWFDEYKFSHPTLFQTEAGVYTEELPLEGVLIWDEKIIFAPHAGRFSVLSIEPRRVRKGETLCQVGGTAVQAQSAGYFIPAIDGLEGEWNYSRIWTGTSSLPLTPNVVFIKNGAQVEAEQAIGKLVPMPQELRAVAWLDVTPSLKQDLERRRVRIKRREDEWGIWADVRTTEIVSQRAKMYMTLPFFPPELLKQRNFSWKVIVGDRYGVYAPVSSVIFRGGVMGVYIVRGNDAVFRKVEVFHADEANFFITSGITPGDLIIVNANNAREGRVNIW